MVQLFLCASVILGVPCGEKNNHIRLPRKIEKFEAPNQTALLKIHFNLCFKKPLETKKALRMQGFSRVEDRSRTDDLLNHNQAL